MIGVDTNVLLRLITRDEPAQVERAQAFFGETRAAGERCFVNTVVLCEVVWTLGRWYRYTREQISDALAQLLDVPMFEIEQRGAVTVALLRYRNSKADFADLLIGLLNAGRGATPTATFDRKLDAEDAFRLLG